MATVRTHKCPMCSAPLPVASTDTDVPCPWCHATIHIERGPKRPAPTLRGAPVLYVGTPHVALVVAMAVCAMLFVLAVMVVLLTRNVDTASPPAEVEPDAAPTQTREPR